MYRPDELSIDEAGELSVLLLSAVTLILLPAALYRHFVGGPGDWRSNRMAAVGGACNVGFVVVVGVMLLLSSGVHPVAFLLWEAGMILVTVGLVKSWTKDDRTSDRDRWAGNTRGHTASGVTATWSWEHRNDETDGASDGGVGGESEGEGAGGGDPETGSGSEWPGAADWEWGRDRSGGTASEGATARGTADGTSWSWGTEAESESGDRSGEQRSKADDAASDSGRSERAGETGEWSHEDLAAVGPAARAERAADILDIEPDADEAAVETAYRERVKETHPDAGGSTDAFIAVKEAYRVLGGSK